jgi:hypothetical protein
MGKFDLECARIVAMEKQQIVRKGGILEFSSPEVGFNDIGGSGHVYCVALGRIPRRTVEYACGILPSRALCGAKAPLSDL